MVVPPIGSYLQYGRTYIMVVHKVVWLVDFGSKLNSQWVGSLQYGFTYNMVVLQYGYATIWLYYNMVILTIWLYTR